MKPVEKAAFLYARGLTAEEIAKVLGLSKEYVRRLLWEARKRGLLKEPPRGEPPQLDCQRLEALIARLEALVTKLEALATRLEPAAKPASKPDAAIVDNEWVKILRQRERFI